MQQTVSIVIPCYNQAHYLRQSIESAVGQTHPSTDVIVVDDGSTDDTAAVAAAYADVRCVRQDNRGPSGARNAGLSVARGAFVIVLDADDRLLPWAATRGIASLQSDPTAAFAVGLERRIDADGAPLPTHRRRPLQGDAYASLVRRCWIMPPGAVVFRRSILEAIGGFDAGLVCAEDYDVYLKLARRWPIIDHYTEVVEYRQHPGTLSRRADRMLMQTMRVLAPHQPRRHASAAHHAAWRARDNVVWYFDRLGDQIAADLKAGHWRRALRGVGVFVSCLPQHRRYAAARLIAPLRRTLRVIATRRLAAS
jgi:glycosyltransferase involved in cell wall biosynthesis